MVKIGRWNVFHNFIDEAGIPKFDTEVYLYENYLVVPNFVLGIGIVRKSTKLYIEVSAGICD